MKKRWVTRSATLLLLAACDSKPLGTPPQVPGAGGHEDSGGAGAEAALPTRIEVLQRVHISSVDGAENLRRATAEVDFGTEPVSRATVSVSLESPCFPFTKWAEVGVPKGQRWPEPCDAFDRTLSVALDEPADAANPETAAPALELLRGVTAFGGPLQVEADMTDVVNGLPGKHRLAIYIDTFSDADGLVSGAKGEWIASVTLDLWSGKAPRRVLAVMPLVRGPQTEVMATPLSFDVPEGAGSARIDYRVTGHGAAGIGPGCVGPAEEFCRRPHFLWLDGQLLSALMPWRDDCSSLCTVTHNDTGVGPSIYCGENPCGDPNSVRASRANWCPGSQTAPFVIDAPALSVAGTHELTREVQGLAPGGTWAVSATYFAFE